MLDRLDGAEGLRWYGPREVERRVGVFSVRIDGVEPAELSVLLESRFGILWRSGLHWPHWRTGRSGLSTGAEPRLSTGHLTGEGDVDAAAQALSGLATVRRCHPGCRRGLCQWLRASSQDGIKGGHRSLRTG